MLDRCVYAIASLNCFSLIFFILPRRLKDMWWGKQGKGELWYIKATPLSVMLLQWFSSLLQLQCSLWVFRILDVHDDKGILLRLRVMYEDSFEIHSYILQEEGIKELFCQNHPQYPRLGEFLDKQTFTIDIHDDQAHWKNLLLLLTFNWDISRREIQPHTKCLFLNTGRWPKALLCYAKRRGVLLCPLPSWKFSFKRTIMRFAGDHDPMYMYHWFKRFGWVGVLKAVIKSVWPNKEKHAYKPSKTLIEYYGQMNLDKPHLYSDLFFWLYTQIPSKDIVLSFNISKDPLDIDKKNILQKHGIQELVLHPKASTIKSAHSFFHWPTRFRVELPTGPLSSHAHRFAQHQTSNYAQQFKYWQELFSQNNIGLYVSWFKYGSRHCVIADAIQSLGGIMVMYQRAIESLPSLGAKTSVDVFFGFSAQGAAIEKEQGSRIPYFVITGYTGDHRFSLLRPYAQELRKQILNKGAQKIMAFFDENSHEGQWNMGHEHVQENYEFLLKKVLTEPWFGLILKPKTPSTLNKRLGPVAILLTEAKATGRCIVCEQGTMSSSFPPALAALGSDIAVHGHLSAATAGVESALAGIPTLMLDREGWKKSNFYKLGEGNVIFNNWEQLWHSCVAIWHSNNSQNKLGDWSGMIDELDPFHDGKAVERMGEYLTWLSQGLKSGQSREHVLIETADRYASKWGKDKIISI